MLIHDVKEDGSVGGGRGALKLEQLELVTKLRVRDGNGALEQSDVA